MAKIETQGGKPDLKKLAKAGRIKLTPSGDVEGQPGNNVVDVIKKPIRLENGTVVGTQTIEVNGGHALVPGTVWRVGLGGPKTYHEKVIKDEERKRLHGDYRFRPSAPVLTDGEAKEYLAYKEFLKEKSIPIAENVDFWAWKK
jgi:hypothetical protein